MAKGRKPTTRRLKVTSKKKRGPIRAAGSQAHNSWRRQANPQQPQDHLGDLLLFQFNPYVDTADAEQGEKGIRRLGSGKGTGGNDADYWMSLIQSDYADPSRADIKWGHERGVDGDAKRAYVVKKALRIPYIVPDTQKDAAGKRRLMLDHLLVGYLDPLQNGATSGLSWGDANAKSHPGVLARLIMVDLYPHPLDATVSLWGVSAPFDGWDPASPAALFDSDPAPLVTDPAAYTTSLRYWEFRGVPHRVEKSVLMTYAVEIRDAAGGLLSVSKGQILIGYEGSGGW